MREIEKSFDSESGKWIDISPRTTTKYKSVTDISKWKPNVHTLNSIEGCMSTEIDDSAYMFKDGKDTGTRIYDVTSPNLDVTERQEAVERIKNNAELDKKTLDNFVKAELENAKENETSATNETTVNE